MEEVTHGTGDPDSAGGLRLTGGVRLACRVPVVAAGHYSPLVRYCSPGVEFMRFEGEYMTRDWEPLLQTPASQVPLSLPFLAPSRPVFLGPWAWPSKASCLCPRLGRGWWGEATVGGAVGERGS